MDLNSREKLGLSYDENEEKTRETGLTSLIGGPTVKGVPGSHLLMLKQKQVESDLVTVADQIDKTFSIPVVWLDEENNDVLATNNRVKPESCNS